MQPPKRAVRFLRWFCREDYVEEIEGDLTEVFARHYAESPRMARRRFVWSVIRYFRPQFMKPFQKQHPILYGMYKSYVTVGWGTCFATRGTPLSTSAADAKTALEMGRME